MRRPALLVLTGSLLLLGGGLLGVLGLRVVQLEQLRTRQVLHGRVQETLGEVARHAVRQAGRLTSPPLEAWAIFRLPVDAGPYPGEGWAASFFAEAEHIERTASDPSAAAALYARLMLEDEGHRAWTPVASLRAGALSLRAGKKTAATHLLDIASRAPLQTLDPEGLPVRLLALYHLATIEPETWATPFLNTAGDGRAVTPSDRLGPDDLILALASRLRDPPRRLTEAAFRVRRGHRAFSALPQPGVTALVDGTVLVRKDGGIQAYDPEALLAGVAVTDVEALLIVPGFQRIERGEYSVPLAPPLESLAVRGSAPPRPRAAPALVGLVVGLTVYLLGAGLGLVALHRALRAAKLQADFVAEVSHELKTPIASVRAMAEFLADGPADDEAKVRDYARRIEGEMGRLGTSVRNVLDAARIERQGGLPVTLRPGDPAAVVETLAAAVAPGLEPRGFSFEARIAPAKRPVLLDAAALQSALANLVDNAAKFSTDVRAIQIDAGPAGESYRIAVRDRGRGVEAKDAVRMFRRFSRSESARKDAVPGVGLGLYVVHEIVDAHHGTVEGRPRREGGSVFTIDLPPAGGGAFAS